MKKTQIIGIIFIAVIIGALTATLSDSGKQADFTTAFADQGSQYRVVGFLDESAPIVYDPITDPSLTKFNMRDENGEVRKVHLLKSKPQGFEQSESLVLIGAAKGDIFVAQDMQMKCPSKYNQDNHMMDEMSASR
ncbi:MAG: cytochrome c maturation protein CcmE [Flavobacteriales bacterium]|nr:cytochrome c maturation protein CcmE [Flavobacteriales bacterium]